MENRVPIFALRPIVASRIACVEDLAISRGNIQVSTECYRHLFDGRRRSATVAIAIAIAIAVGVTRYGHHPSLIRTSQITTAITATRNRRAEISLQLRGVFSGSVDLLVSVMARCPVAVEADRLRSGFAGCTFGRIPAHRVPRPIVATPRSRKRMQRTLLIDVFKGR